MNKNIKIAEDPVNWFLANADGLKGNLNRVTKKKGEKTQMEAIFQKKFWLQIENKCHSNSLNGIKSLIFERENVK